MNKRTRQRAYERGDLIYHSGSRTFGVVVSEDDVYQHAHVKFFSGETITINYESIEKYWSSKWLPQALSSTFINVTLEDENEGKIKT
tara:strand:- start:1154 stop:1414 length:261 start_codon:yes stop_codon:yes gene_type:complete